MLVLGMDFGMLTPAKVRKKYWNEIAYAFSDTGSGERIAKNTPASRRYLAIVSRAKTEKYKGHTIEDTRTDGKERGQTDSQRDRRVCLEGDQRSSSDEVDNPCQPQLGPVHLSEVHAYSHAD